MSATINNIRLTQFSHGGGCGCKIAPQVLDTILHSQLATPDHKNLLVGNSSKDDAAAYDLGNGTALISTTDFFMPIVDDAQTFGKIASANAISDVYAMGGKPVLAIAILGWPVDKIPAEVAQQVIEGARLICAEAGIPLAGGHSIDSPEPIFGLAVNGLVNIPQLKQNNTAKEGDILFLTKPLGVGILSTAQKRSLLKEEHLEVLLKQLTQLNSVGEALGKIDAVHAMTDVTGFGLLGHLIEMCEGSKLSASVPYDTIPLIPFTPDYVALKAIPGATKRNWASYGHKVSLAGGIDETAAYTVLADPQTNGGLLISVGKEAADLVQQLLSTLGLYAQPIGQVTALKEKSVYINKG
ncbi:MAG: selenide, water dikinase SelD [Bacteroidota bacterium]|nr:selenide, water dikinase SelD [Bacteroidota bacterium]